MKRSILVALILVSLPLTAGAEIKAIALDIGLGYASHSTSGDVLEAAEIEPGLALDAKIGAALTDRFNLYINYGYGQGAAADILGDSTSYVNLYFGLLGRYFFTESEDWNFYVQAAPAMHGMSIEGKNGFLQSDPVFGGMIGLGCGYYPWLTDDGSIHDLHFGLEVNYHFASFGKGEIDLDHQSAEDMDIDGRGDMLMIMLTMGYDVRLNAKPRKEPATESVPKTNPPKETPSPK